MVKLWGNKVFRMSLISCLLIVTVLAGSLFNITSAPNQGVVTLGQKVITLGSVAEAAGSVDYTFDGVADDVQLQAALNALPATGGRLVIVSSVQINLTALTTVTRAINNVIIEGSGRGTYFVGDGATAIFTAGGNNWQFINFRTDTGGISNGATTGWMWTGVTIDATYYAYRSPYGNSAFNDATVASLTDSGLTNGRIPIAGAGGLLGDDADLTFSGSTLTATNIADSSLTNGRLAIAGVGGLLGDDADLAWSGGNNLNTTNLTDSALTAGRITLAGVGGLLSDNASLTWDGSLDTDVATLQDLGVLGANTWVVASDAPASIRTYATTLQNAGYPVWVADGVNDQVELLASITALPDFGGGDPAGTKKGRTIWTGKTFTLGALLDITPLHDAVIDARDATIVGQIRLDSAMDTWFYFGVVGANGISVGIDVDPRTAGADGGDDFIDSRLYWSSISGNQQGTPGTYGLRLRPNTGSILFNLFEGRNVHGYDTLVFSPNPGAGQSFQGNIIRTGRLYTGVTGVQDGEAAAAGNFANQYEVELDDAALTTGVSIYGDNSYYLIKQIANPTNPVVLQSGATGNIIVAPGTITTITDSSSNFTNRVVTKGKTSLSMDLQETSLVNLLPNGDFEVEAPPKYWTLVGAGATDNRSNAQAKIGTYSVILTRNGTDTRLWAAVDDPTYLRNRTVTLGGWVYATVASRAFIGIRDDTGVTTSAYHPGDSTWRWLTISKTIDAAATYVYGETHINAGDTSSYTDGMMLIENLDTVSAFAPKPQSDNRYNSGTATLLNGNTFVTVTHGLPSTPTDITITFLENPTNAVADWWVDNIGATTFQFNGVDPGASNLDFRWTARY